MLSLEEQLNVICDKLTNGAVRHYLSYSSPVSWKLQLLPLEKGAVFVGTEKMTMDVGPEVCFQLGREVALRFYMLLVVLVGRVNKGGLAGRGGGLSRFPGLLSSWCYAWNQTCTNCGFLNSALAYVQPGGT